MAYLAVKEPTARGEKKAELRGCCSLDSGHTGAAVRPLDGGALTRWGARTPATAPWSLLALAQYPLGGCGCAEREESGVDGERKERTE